jgi:hypothetical protein
MTWKGVPPVGELNRKEDHPGIPLGQKALRTIERRLERHPELPKWDILLRPASSAC